MLRSIELVGTERLNHRSKAGIKGEIRSCFYLLLGIWLRHIETEHYIHNFFILISYQVGHQ